MAVPESISVAIHQAVEGNYLSDTHYPFVPATLPLYAAICAVKLPPGCLPSDDGRPRIATGVASDASQAEFLARMEGVERYSVQYSSALPETLVAREAFGGPVAARPIEQLTIGSPGEAPTSTKGAAAGTSFLDASSRAVLELIEHFYLENSGGSYLARSERVYKETDNLTEALAEQLRTLSFKTLAKQSSFAVVGAMCSDFNMARPTFGTAAAASWAEAAKAAAYEAVFSWRNMVELERNAVDISSFSKQQKLAVERYRGTQEIPDWAYTEAKPQPCKSLEFESSLENILVKLTGQRVSLFDMASPSLRIPVVRAVVG